MKQRRFTQWKLRNGCFQGRDIFRPVFRDLAQGCFHLRRLDRTSRFLPDPIVCCRHHANIRWIVSERQRLVRWPCNQDADMRMASSVDVLLCETRSSGCKHARIASLTERRLQPAEWHRNLRPWQSGRSILPFREAITRRTSFPAFCRARELGSFFLFSLG